MSKLGWRTFPSAPQVDARVIDALRRLPVSLLSDNMSRATGTYGLTAFHRPRPMAGTAVTVHTRPGDNLPIYRAYDYCRPGDVMVIDGGGESNQAFFNDTATTEIYT